MRKQKQRGENGLSRKDMSDSLTSLSSILVACYMMLYDYNYNILQYMGVSKNRGTPKSSILIGFSIINHPFWDTLIFGNTYILPIKLFVLLIIPSLNPLLLLYDDNHTFQQKKLHLGGGVKHF